MDPDRCDYRRAARDAIHLPFRPVEFGAWWHWWGPCRTVSEFLRVPVQTLCSWRTNGYEPPARRVGTYLRHRPEDVTRRLDGLDDGAA